MIESINNLEDVLAKYFVDKDIPMEIQSAIAGIEMIIQELETEDQPFGPDENSSLRLSGFRGYMS